MEDTKQAHLYTEEEVKKYAVDFINWAVEEHSVVYEGFILPVYIKRKKHDANMLFDLYIQSLKKSK